MWGLYVNVYRIPQREKMGSLLLITSWRPSRALQRPRPFSRIPNFDLLIPPIGELREAVNLKSSDKRGVCNMAMDALHSWPLCKSAHTSSKSWVNKLPLTTRFIELLSRSLWGRYCSNFIRKIYLFFDEDRQLALANSILSHVRKSDLKTMTLHDNLWNYASPCESLVSVLWHWVVSLLLYFENASWNLIMVVTPLLYG